jgi:hypothetical protein
MIIFKGLLQELVETAMLAAISGLVFLMSSTLGLDKYCGYILPLPILIAGLRWGSGAAWWSMWISTCLVTGVPA